MTNFLLLWNTSTLCKKKIALSAYVLTSEKLTTLCRRINIYFYSYTISLTHLERDIFIQKLTSVINII